MACGGCAKRSATRNNRKDTTEKSIMDEYKYLNDRQIRARLEIYKKKYCPVCVNRYKCDYEFYVNCKKNK